MADELYRPGYSFENSPVAQIATPASSRPWFYQNTAVGPLSKVSKLAPFWKDGVMHRYQPVWNRAAKMRNVNRLGAYFHDVPSISELGEAPPATGESASAVRTGDGGFLQNLQSLFAGGADLLTVAAQGTQAVTGQLQKREEAKTQTAMAQMQGYLQQLSPFGSSSGSNWVLWVAGIGAVGVAAYYMLGRK